MNRNEITEVRIYLGNREIQVSNLFEDYIKNKIKELEKRIEKLEQR